MLYNGIKSTGLWCNLMSLLLTIFVVSFMIIGVHVCVILLPRNRMIAVAAGCYIRV